MGVIQLINKQHGNDFTTTDEKRIKELADTLAIALFNHYKSGKKIPMRYEELVKREIISSQEMERAMVIATQQEREIETVLMDNFLVPKSDLGNTLALVYKTRFIDLKQDQRSVFSLVDEVNIEILRSNFIVPLEKKKTNLIIAAKNPANKSGVLEIKKLFNAAKVSVYLAFGDDINNYLLLSHLRPMKITSTA